ncbi:hypothetical protein BHECKSOX2_1178 [Bathymodiolus heckerae thiotrophic gill symbiont]|nr:hypothetical protein [uncultured Gammaproteobacteria bacterium]CAC9443551.1 hypothetical protein [uncultured Gammaproteobacteria bacterium]SMN13948.1 hypothetical protein BHECKSOX2_1178 [Bathymodiolus heckerae thiotrophic gill symbiont]
MISRIQFLSNWYFFKLCPSKAKARFKKNYQVGKKVDF